jgi:hypothetical protein
MLCAAREVAILCHIRSHAVMVRYPPHGLVA